MKSKAAGCIFASVNTGRILLNYRSEQVSSYPNTWAFWGGKIEPGEKIVQGLSREVREEVGFIPEYIKLLPLDVFKTSLENFTFYSFVVLVEDEFIPQINWESSGWGWFDVGKFPSRMHPGAWNVLEKQNFDNVFQQIIDSI